MTITERLRTEFQGMTAMITGFMDAWRASRAYNRALEDMKALKMKDHVNPWVWEVCKHSVLSCADAQDIYDFLSERPSICKYSRNLIAEFVIEMANCGHTGDMILRYLSQIDMESDRLARTKLEMGIE